MKAFWTLLAALPLAAQTPKSLAGYWTNATLTPLERPAELGTQQFFTKDQAARYAKDVAERNNSDRRESTGDVDVGRAYNNFWRDGGTSVISTLRTSLITDPENGRIPALTPTAQQKVTARAEARLAHPADGPEDRSLQERCILWPAAGPPMLPVGYNSYYQIVEGSGFVAISSEMIHDTRLVPTDGRPHLPSQIRLWLGDPRGRWEGNTLVVDSTNFTDKTAFRGSGDGLHVVERFTRTAPDTLTYEFTVTDPASFTKPWSAQIPMTKYEGPLFEYACHEGNHAMSGILAGARTGEKK